MKKLLLSVTCLGLACLIPTLALASGIEIGVNTAVKGNVTIKTGEQDALVAIVSEPVFLNDLVNSPRLGTLQVLLADGTTFTVGPDCILTIDKFVYDPNTKKRNVLLARITKGIFRFMSGNISKKNSQNVSIQTPVATLGIRGTIVEGLVGDEATILMAESGLLSESTSRTSEDASLFVLRGPGQNTKSKHRKGEIRVTSGGKTVTVKEAGMAVFVAGDGTAPMGPFPLPPNMEAKFDASLRSAPTGGPSFRPFAFEMQSRDNPERTYGEGAQTNTRSLIGETPNAAVNPISDMDWPTIYEDGQGNPASCNPNNPHFPNC